MTTTEYTEGWYESERYPLRELDGFYAPYYFDGDKWFEVDQAAQGRQEVSPETHGPFRKLGSIELAAQERTDVQP